MPLRALTLAVLLAATLALHADPAPGSHAAAFTDDGLLKLDNEHTPLGTHLILNLGEPLGPTDTVIWCGTFQLAWNEAIGLVGEKLRFFDQPPLIHDLNREDFTRHDLSRDSYVAVADFYRNDVAQKISDALQATFHGAQWQELAPTPIAHPSPDDFAAYAYLFKDLQFPDVFADTAPLAFNVGPANDGLPPLVKTFGFTDHKDKLPPSVFSQVKIYDYQSDSDFIIKLKTRDPQDQLILAKVPPAATLQATIDAVLKRMTTGSVETAQQNDNLSIPKLNFRFDKHFTKLEGLVLNPSANAKIHSRLTIARAEQIVRFQLNEKGAVLKSEAIMEMRMLAIARPVPVHEMIFDKPFLILMKQANSSQPYFAIWVGNPTLLLPAR